MEVRFETKLSDYALIFVLILSALTVISDSRILFLEKTAELNIQYDNAMDNAVESAMEGIVELDDGEELKINKEEILERFFLGLSINLGLSEGDSMRQELECYFPVIAIMLEDGLYSWRVNDEENGKEFSEKIPYCLEKENYAIFYRFDKEIVYQDKAEDVERRGDYRQIRKLYPVEELSDDNFDEIRRRTIISVITDQMNRQLELHNRYTALKGISYYFSLPVIDMEEWYRTVDDVTLLCVFQGYPYSSAKLGTYNKVVLSGARVHKKQETWNLKEDLETGKEKLDGGEEFYQQPQSPEEIEDRFFQGAETENIMEEQEE